MFYRIILALFFSALLCLSARSAEPLQRVLPESVGMDSALLSRVDSVVMQSIARGEIPGAVVGVLRGGKVAYRRSFGMRRIWPDSVEMTDDTIFDLASLTKVTATLPAVMVLQSRGLIRFKAKVSDYIPDFHGWTDTLTQRRKPIRVMDLLTHTSGLPAYASPSTVTPLYAEGTFPSKDAMMDYICHCPRLSAPRKVCRYSCLNFVTLQRIVESVTGESLDVWTRKNIFEPLEMNQTCFLPDSVSCLRTAPTQVEQGRAWCGEVHDPLARVLQGGVSGNAGLFSTLDDLLRYGSCILSGGGEILNRRAIRRMSHVPHSYRRFKRTVGWDSYPEPCSMNGGILTRGTFGHTGFTGTSILLDPEHDLCIVILTNRVHPASNTSVSRLRREVTAAVANSLLRR